MRLFTRLALFLCLLAAIPMLAPSALAAEVDARIIARLDALERENAALRSRLNRIEFVQGTDDIAAGCRP